MTHDSRFTIHDSRLNMPRHSVLVRITHWVTALSVGALVVSGIAILLAHPRLYWGEVGVVGMPSLVDLPLPFVLAGQTGWGRSLHFLSAWVVVLTGALYVSGGLHRAHFRWPLYTPLQRRTYRLVVFGLLPLLIWTGLAMSPAITSVIPAIVQVLGGHQSARTIHFAAAAGVVCFVGGHVAMVAAAGFRSHVSAMITGGLAPPKETA
jgi:thiosulfate reductase cytochrome b subunit